MIQRVPPALQAGARPWADIAAQLTTEAGGASARLSLAAGLAVSANPEVWRVPAQRGAVAWATIVAKLNAELAQAQAPRGMPRAISSGRPLQTA